jgi:hypothetical protein
MEVVQVMPFPSLLQGAVEAITQTARAALCAYPTGHLGWIPQWEEVGAQCVPVIKLSISRLARLRLVTRPSSHTLDTLPPFGRAFCWQVTCRSLSLASLWDIFSLLCCFRWAPLPVASCFFYATRRNTWACTPEPPILG